MEKGKGVTVVLLALAFLFFLAFWGSVSAGILHWRVSREPGVLAGTELLVWHRILLVLGGAGTVGIQGALAWRRNLKDQFLSWALCGAATVLYIPFFLLTLLLSV